MEFAYQLEQRMDERAMTVDGLALRSGVARRLIDRVMRGRVDLEVRLMAKLARAVGGVCRLHMGPKEFPWPPAQAA